MRFRADGTAIAWTALLLCLSVHCAAGGTNGSGTSDAGGVAPADGGGTAAARPDGSTVGDAVSVDDGGPASGRDGSGGDGALGKDAAANSGDAGGGAGRDAGLVAPCSAPGLLFCDDFESLPLGATFNAPWSTMGVAGTSAVTVDDSVPAHSGTHSVLTHPEADSFQTLLVFHDPAVLPVASARFYLRAQIRFGAPMSAGHNSFLIADLFSAPGAGMTARVGQDNQMLMMSVGGDANTYLSNQSFY